jgi:hypothetical protein
MLEIAATDAAGPHPEAMNALAKFLLQPGRPYCSGELKLAPVLAASNSQFQRDTARARQLFFKAASLGNEYVLLVLAIFCCYA